MKKSTYPSRYSPGKYVTAAQYIIELVCEHKAKFDKTELPIKFWNHPLWSSFFKKNLRKVHQLLKKYDEKAVIAAIKSKDFQYCYSIFTEKFTDLVQQEQYKLSTQVQPKSDKINRDTVEDQPRQRPTKKTLLTKLDEI